VDRLFLDANVLFSAAYNSNSSLRQLWALPGTELLSCPFAVQEAHSNLARARPAQLPELLALLGRLVLIPDPLPGTPLPPGVRLPDKDKPILLAALDGQATHLLTGDVRHFGPYFGRTIAGVLIVRPAAYLQARQQTP
jgi:uncharacterized protein